MVGEPRGEDLRPNWPEGQETLTREERLSIYTDWLATLDRRVQEGVITQEVRNATVARSLLARDVLLERATDRSKKDSLTGLPNQKNFMSQLDGIQDDTRPTGLLIFDIDDLKDVNRREGYLATSKTLAEIALTLTTGVRQLREESENDIVARYGGDEFAVLLRGVLSEEDLERIAEKLRSSINDSPFTVTVGGEKRQVGVTATIGGGIYRGGSPEKFFEKVNKEALDPAKEQGKNRSLILRPQT